MSAGHDHREPLDADERDLAARLARIGPLDGPSPSLDAKILAAAHAAAATRKPRRSRWPAWLGVPPALVTGVGVAAAAVLALGLVWQLRPQIGVLPAHDEAAGADEEVFIIAEPSTRARAPIVNPPPFPSEPQMPASARAVRDATESKAADAAASMADAPSASADVVAGNAAEAAPAAAPPPSLAAEGVSAAAAADAAKEEAGFVATPPAAPAAQARKQAHATYTTAARAAAERRERAAGLVAPAPQAQAAAPAEAESDRTARDSTVLDRVEVTGSRIKRSDADAYEPLSKVSVNEDKVLSAGEWLERIRARRDEGDMDGARASLRLFRREHPRVRVPDDLRALLVPDTKQ